MYTLRLDSVIAYLDDIIIMGRSPEEHPNRLREVLMCLQGAGLRARKYKRILE